MRAVLDPNVLISALLSPAGAPGEILRRWLDGEFELVVSRALLAELRRALAYPKLRLRIAADDAEDFIGLLQRLATMPDDATPGPRRSRDPGDEYLLDLAESAAATLVTGDDDLLALKQLPVDSARAFLARLRAL